MSVEPLWDVNDVAAFLKCSVSWVQKASARGDLPSLRISRMLRFDPNAIRAYARGERAPRGQVHVLHKPRL